MIAARPRLTFPAAPFPWSDAAAALVLKCGDYVSEPNCRRNMQEPALNPDQRLEFWLSLHKDRRGLRWLKSEASSCRKEEMPGCGENSRMRPDSNRLSSLSSIWPKTTAKEAGLTFQGRLTYSDLPQLVQIAAKKAIARRVLQSQTSKKTNSRCCRPARQIKAALDRRAKKTMRTVGSALRS